MTNYLDVELRPYRFITSTTINTEFSNCRRLSTEVAVPLNMNNGVRTGGETGNAATNNMENENTPEVEEELNDSVQFVDVLNNITGNSEEVLEEVVYITDSETEEDSIASRENLNVALDPVLVSKLCHHERSVKSLVG